MNKREPKKICIICEGFEEYDYMVRLTECKVFDPIYSIYIRNARGIDSIAPIYQHVFQNDNFDLILIFCDTELEPYPQFKNIHKKINKFHGKSVAKYLIYFSNPCSMQIVLSHFGAVALKTNSKSGNAPLIQKLTGVRSYEAHSGQRSAMMRQINGANYLLMKGHIANLSTNYKVCPSTNFLSLLQKLESPNSLWVNKIASKLECE